MWNIHICRSFSDWISPWGFPHPIREGRDAGGRMVVTMDVGLKKKLNGPSNIKYGFLNWENIGTYRNM